MMGHSTINGSIFAEMVRAGSANLHLHMEEVNELNVFPIPDGDTGENMMLTMQGGVGVADDIPQNLSVAAERIANGMLLGARGNSGVILSQFFAGIASGFAAVEEADVTTLEKAISAGVKYAFDAVMVPTAGTILTVLQDACDYANKQNCSTAEAYFSAFAEEAKRSLQRTPELLSVLKEAGVVDSGGAGLLYIAEGMKALLYGQKIDDLQKQSPAASVPALNPDLFGTDDVMEFGYCTELLLRLQTVKTDVDHFDVNRLTAYLQEIGDSVVTVKNGSIVKLHVHTMTPYKVLEFCQQFGEFLTVKIENMMLQHNDTVAKKEFVAASTERRRFAVVTVASGTGIRNSFLEMGADEVIFGGQTMNPSTEDFLEAFARVNADVVFVLPNNGNILLAARQAAKLYKESEIRVLPSVSLGEGYAALSMLCFDSGDADTIESEMTEAMQGVLTAEVSQSIRDAEMDGVCVKKGDYIAILGKHILAAGNDREQIAASAAQALDLCAHSVLLLLRGKGVSASDSASLVANIQSQYPLLEICESDGGQDVYDYILIVE